MKGARHKRPHSVWFLLCELFRRGKSVVRKSVCFGGGGGGLTVNGHEESYWGDILNWFIVMVPYLGKLTKKNPIVHLVGMNSMILKYALIKWSKYITILLLPFNNFNNNFLITHKPHTLQLVDMPRFFYICRFLLYLFFFLKKIFFFLAIFLLKKLGYLSCRSIPLVWILLIISPWCHLICSSASW